MKRIGLYFGSYNPIHIGHLIIANAMLEYTPLEEVWFVVSPQNPFKVNQSLLADNERLEMVRLAVRSNLRLKACDVELGLPKPSYTVATLAKLKEMFPEEEFSIIMGSDNLERFDKWKNYEEILSSHHLYVYPRPNHADCPLLGHENITLLEDLPNMEISSTYIREEIAKSNSVRYLVPDEALRYIKEKGFYL
ncbi:MAG: nicotinate-nucleotide adenylyltransferase [Bacteroidales bacterium]|nr:nicotinate-nucleotide adenylyltransferase [Bacteroidales bacterium]